MARKIKQKRLKYSMNDSYYFIKTGIVTQCVDTVIQMFTSLVFQKGRQTFEVGLTAAVKPTAAP
jgi:hypothetical protein